MRRYLIPVLIAAAMLAAGCGGSSAPAAPTPTPTPTPTAPAMMLDSGKQYSATLVTEKGNISLELYAADVPVTVNNFVYLARSGFYDGCTFHRVFPGEFAQGGDPSGTGLGTPGYYIPDEITEHKHVTGALSMANSGKNQNGCQFFICYTELPHLDGHYSVFGQLTAGMEVLESLTPRDPSQFPDYAGDTIYAVIIEEN